MTTFSSARPRLIVSRTANAAARRSASRDPLGAESAGGNASIGHAAATSARQLPLADLVDRASAQLLVIRSTLDEAARIEHRTAGLSSELERRLEQGERFAHEIDRRMQSAAKAAGAIDQAGTALRELESVLVRLRQMNESAEARFAEQLAKATAGAEARVEETINRTLSRVLAKAGALESQFNQRLEALVNSARAADAEAMLARQRDHYEGLLSAQRTQFESRLTELGGRIDDAASRVELTQQQVAARVARAWTDIERQITETADTLGAKLDRHTAAAQARVAIVLDAASDRLQVMEAQAEHLTGVIADRAGGLCAQAASALGVDPRTGEPLEDAPADTLSGAIAQTQRLVDRCATARAGLQDVTERAERARTDLSEVTQRAAAATAEQQDGLDRFEERIAGGLERVRTYENTLELAREQHERALGAMRGAQDAMDTMRGDLETIAAAARYHVEQVQGATSRLQAASADADAAAEHARTEAEHARVRVVSIERAMNEMTAQAEALVGLARDVGTLLEQARAQHDQTGSDAGELRKAS